MIQDLFFSTDVSQKLIKDNVQDQIGANYNLYLAHKQGIIIPLYKKEDEVTRECRMIAILLSAGVDRNIIVYDRFSNLSKRLISRLKSAQYKQSNKRLTDLIIGSDSFINLNKSFMHKLHKDGVKIHHTPVLNINGYGVNFYENKLDCILPDKKTNIIIGITKEEDIFLNPYSENQEGFAVLDTKNVLLGAI